MVAQCERMEEFVELNSSVVGLIARCTAAGKMPRVVICCRVDSRSAGIIIDAHSEPTGLVGAVPQSRFTGSWRVLAWDPLPWPKIVVNMREM